MKNVMKFGLVMAMLFGMAFSAFANTTDFSLRLKNASGKNISFAVVEAKDVTISIFGQNDELLFSEKINSDGAISRKYDLSQFPSGTYTLEAESSAKVTRYEITVDGTSAKVGEVIKAEVKKPVIVRKANERVTMSIINIEQTPVEIAIYDESGAEVFKNTYPANVSVIKMFSFANVGYGNYTFVSRYSNKTFTDSIKAGK